MIIVCQSLGSRPILVLELFTLVRHLFGTTSHCLSVQPVQLLPSRNIWRHISLIWPVPDRYRHSPWPVDVTELFPRFCCWTLIWLSRHWSWLRRGYWCYRSLIDWLSKWRRLCYQAGQATLNMLKPCEVNVGDTIHMCIAQIETTGHKSSWKQFRNIQIKIYADQVTRVSQWVSFAQEKRTNIHGHFLRQHTVQFKPNKSISTGLLSINFVFVQWVWMTQIINVNARLGWVLWWWKKQKLTSQEVRKYSVTRIYQN